MKPDYDLLSYRRRIPRFIRQSSWKVKRVKNVWRKPRGRQSKMREQMKGRPPIVKVGYRMPVKFRNLHKSGKMIVEIRRLDDFKNYDPNKVVVVFPRVLGMRKKLKLIEYAKNNGYYVLNLNPEKALELIQKELEKRKEKRKLLMEKRKSAKRKHAEKNKGQEKTVMNQEEKSKQEKAKTTSEITGNEAVSTSKDKVSAQVSETNEEKKVRDKLITKPK